MAGNKSALEIDEPDERGSTAAEPKASGAGSAAKPTSSLVSDDSVDEDITDAPAGADPGNALDSTETGQSDPSQRGTLSPHLLKRRRRNRLLGLACVLTLIFVFTVLMKQGAFDRYQNVEVPGIASGVLFDQLCTEVQDQQLAKLHVPDFEVNDAMVAQVAGLDCIETLILDQGIVTDEAIKTISALPNLQHLRLRLSPVGDEGLKLLAATESLWYLNLPHAECTDQGVGVLAALPRLRQLRLGSANLGNGVTREIATITSLRGIHLIGVEVTDEGLKTLASMPHLESLYLDDSAVTEAGWEYLFREHPHLHVHIDQSHHDRDPNLHKHH